MKYVFIWICFWCWALPTVDAQQERVLIHAHNDYHQRVPFYQAYAQQVYAIEADVFAENGAILVGHDRDELHPTRTLEALYINPIVCLFSSNAGRPWAASENRFVLLIDLKTPAATTLQAVVDLIAKYPEVFDETVNPYAATVVISGAMPDPVSFADFPSFIQFDGRLGVEYTEDQLKRVEFVSAPFSGYTRWNGKGTLIEKDKMQVSAAIEAAHRLGKKFRFWGTPDGVTAWNTLYAMGVDIINTDQIERCAAFFSDFETRRFRGQPTSPDSGNAPTEKMDRKGYRLIAHRGGVVDSVTAENSSLALMKASINGYWMVEIDLRLTRDSVLIIHHDRNLQRYFGVEKSVSEMDWVEISQLVGNLGNKVLTFEEALKFCQAGNLQVMVDNKIKGNDTVLFGKVVELLKKYGRLEQAMMIGTTASTPFFTGKVRLSCTRKQLEDYMSKPGFSPDDYFLFSSDIKEADVEWTKKHGILAVGVLNAWAFRSDNMMEEAEGVAEKLKRAGVSYYQLDSMFDFMFE